MTTPLILKARERILVWMANQRQPGDWRPPPVLLSVMQESMGESFDLDAFDGLLRDGVIHAEYPEAKPGDSGRQFWNFAHLTTEQPA